VHRILLENRILIIENLANLDRLPEGRFAELICLPLHITESDGAPTRVVAFL
jgi:arylformamidase